MDFHQKINQQEREKMSTDQDHNEIATLIKAGSPIIQVVTFERERVYGFINNIARELDMDWYRWSNVGGLEMWDKKSKMFTVLRDDLLDAIAILQHFKTPNTNGILIIEDYHGYMSTQVSPEIIRHLREIALFDKTMNKVLVICQPVKQIPPELIKEMPVVEVSLPGVEILKVIFDQVIRKFSLPPEKYNRSERLIQATLGLTIMEARLAFSKAIVEKGKLTEEEIPIIIEEKGNLIKKQGLLEYINQKENMQNVGGLDLLKDWLSRRGNAFSKEAENYGLETPRGVLLLGVPGCGKSLCAKAVANAWNFPLLRFDLGKVYSGIVGESEANIRHALDVAKALAPCVLWIDEIEKGLSGVQSSNQTDSGVSARVFGTFLTWMQEKKEPVFVVATANNISQVPPELLRKGRFDEIFFVDLPTPKEREDIFKIHIAKKKRDPSKFKLRELSEVARDFTGAEIEEAVKEGMIQAFSQKREVTPDDINNALKNTSPLAKTMQEVIQQLRRWAVHRAKFASSLALQDVTAHAKGQAGTKEEIPHLRQEMQNPFL